MINICETKFNEVLKCFHHEVILKKMETKMICSFYMYDSILFKIYTFQSYWYDYREKALKICFFHSVLSYLIVQGSTVGSFYSTKYIKTRAG